MPEIGIRELGERRVESAIGHYLQVGKPGTTS